MDQQEEQRTMDLLSNIAHTENVSQRYLSETMGIALGVVNASIKRCAKMGWIKIKQTPASRYAYFLTPSGFLEKSRLTKLYMQRSFALYRQASRHYQDVFSRYAQQKSIKVVLVGLSDLTEIAYLWAQRYAVPLSGVVAIEPTDLKTFEELPIFEADTSWPDHGVWVWTASADVDASMLRRLNARNLQEVIYLQLL